MKKKKICEHDRLIDVEYVGDNQKQRGYCTDCMKWLWTKNNNDWWRK